MSLASTTTFPECPCPDLCNQLAQSAQLDLNGKWALFNQAVEIISSSQEQYEAAGTCADHNPKLCGASLENHDIPRHPFHTQGILATAGDRRLAINWDSIFGKGIWQRYS